jgi:predicted TIM-barrel fold metal-dependent hydrolase
MKIIGLEEHLVIPELLAAWSQLPGIHQTPEAGFGDEPLARRLRDVGDQRLASMDDQGVDVQVLSLNTPGVQNLAPADAVTVAREANDALAGIVSRNKARFQAFAAIPTPEPDSAGDELEGAITRLGLRGAMLYGRTGTTNADDRWFDGLYATAARLHAPIYLHPQTPVAPVREAYYSGYGDEIDAMFANFGIGWYYETGVQLLRMIFSGVFDRHTDLQVIVGHWGELVLFYLEHTAVMQAMGLHLDRPLEDYFRQNVWVTGSGLYSNRYLRWSAEVVGIDRIMFSTDYPFRETEGGAARAFLEDAPLTEAEKAAIGSGNWERLMKPLGATQPS